ncbi:MAG: esterase/lipase family protein [Burkholderiales bacterium]
MKSNPADADFSLAELAGAALRPVAELGLLLADPVYWGVGVPRGDGRPVLVLPGLFAGDGYLQPLRDWLRRAGYTPVKSGIERNPGWSEELISELAGLAHAEYRRSRQRVTIIGHSMGGLQGRSVAGRLPQIVRHVIALGSPLAMARSRIPGTVRMTAIYSREDRIVPHPAALERDPRAKNVEVPGSHIGLAFNPAVYRVLARTLAAPDPEVI